MLKRALCLLLAGALALGLLAGCRAGAGPAPAKASEEPLAVMIISTAPEEAFVRISARISQLVQEKLGFPVQLLRAPLTEYNATLNRLEALGRAPDIFLAYQPASLMNAVERGAALPLNGLLAEFPALAQSVYDGYWPNVTLGGTIYAIPTDDSPTYAQGFVARKDILDSLGIDAADITGWDELHDMLLRVKRELPDVVPIVPHQGRLFVTLEEDPLNDGIGVLVKNAGTTVENLYESVEFHELCRTMHTWYREGLILEEAHAYTVEPRTVLISAFNGLGYFARLNDFTSTNGHATEGYPLVNIQLSPPYVNTSVTNLSWCISAASARARQAMQLIQLLYEDRELADLCLYGQEGIDYSRVDENRVTLLGQSGTWNSTLWGWPNRNAGSQWVAPDTLEPTKFALAGAPVTSPANGFFFDSSPVQRQLEGCRLVVAKYAAPLMCGYLNPDEVIPLFNRELYEAGLADVMAEKQHQLDLFLQAQP